MSKECVFEATLFWWYWLNYIKINITYLSFFIVAIGTFKLGESLHYISMGQYRSKWMYIDQCSVSMSFEFQLIFLGIVIIIVIDLFLAYFGEKKM
jgi:hypothetical protein